MKPILFNTDMVRALLDGRKTVTRRVVKVPPYYPNFYKLHDNADGAITGPRDRLYAGFYNDKSIFYVDGEKHIDAVYYRAPYQPGDILYVRETWVKLFGRIVYKADYKETEVGFWRPSIHMPKEAARIFLRVTEVRIERLQGITVEQAIKEGCDGRCDCPSSGADGSLSCVTRDFSVEQFMTVWDSTIKPADRDQYGWEANPWVWVIGFERISKEEALENG